jgi:hypothetical protein
MSKRDARKVNTRLWWLGLGAATVGCLDPLVEDPGSHPNEQAEVMPIPVSPGGVDAPDVTGSSAGVAPSQPIVDVAPTTGTTTTTATAGATSGGASAPATNLPPSSGTDGPRPCAPDPGSTSDQGATGAAPSDLDAGAFDQPDADAGPDGSLDPTSDHATNTGTGAGSGS